MMAVTNLWGRDDQKMEENHLVRSNLCVCVCDPILRILRGSAYQSRVGPENVGRQKKIKLMEYLVLVDQGKQHW